MYCLCSLKAIYVWMSQCTMHSFSNSNLLELIHLTTENHLPLETCGRGHFFHIRHFNHCDRDCLQCLLLRKCHFPIFKSLLVYEDYIATISLLLGFGFFFYILEKFTGWGGWGVLVCHTILHTSSYFHTLKQRSYTTIPNKKRYMFLNVVKLE